MCDFHCIKYTYSWPNGYRGMLQTFSKKIDDDKLKGYCCVSPECSGQLEKELRSSFIYQKICYVILAVVLIAFFVFIFVLGG